MFTAVLGQCLVIKLGKGLPLERQASGGSGVQAAKDIEQGRLPAP
jgi:hypothetical protein